MKRENKSRWMIWAIVALALMNISTFATIIYHQYHSEVQDFEESRMQPVNDSEIPNYSGRFFRDRLNFNADQMNRFREFNPAFRQQVRFVTQELNSKRKKMLDEMASENADTVVLNRLSDSIGILHSNLKKFTFHYYLDIKNICNAQQQKQLEQIFSEILATDQPLGQPGKGRFRWQRGRRNN